MSTYTKQSPGDAGGGDVVALLGRLAGVDPASCDRHGLDAVVADIARGRAWLDSIEVAAAARARQLAAAGSGDPVEAVLSGGGRRSQRNSSRAVERADVCAQMPAINEALANGALTGEHVDAIATAAASLTDTQRAELAEQAADLAAAGAASSVDDFERECRRRARIVAAEPGSSLNERNRRNRTVREWIDRETGMGKTMISLDAETHGRMWAAINAAVAAAKAAKQDDESTFAHVQVDALVDLVTGGRSLDRRTPEISVLIDLDTLIDGLHDNSTCETSQSHPLEADTVRRLACEANIVPIVLGGTGIPLDVGRSRRLATREQRLALRAMYRTCAMPGCNRPFDHCQIHHVDEWRRDQGPTNLDKLLPLCTDHHHLVHEGRWRLRLEPARTLTITRPDGTIAFHGRTDHSTNRAA